LGANETFEVKHMGNTVRVALPPEKYSPPDSPMDLPPPDETKEAVELAEGEEAPPPPLPPAPRVPRKHAFPWPAPKVRISPRSIPLPVSPTEEDLDAVEAALSLGEDSPAKPARATDGDGDDPSLIPSWVGKEVVFSVPNQVSG